MEFNINYLANINKHERDDHVQFDEGPHIYTVDGDDISASFKDGMLSVSIPKKEPELPKKKMVKIS